MFVRKSITAIANAVSWTGGRLLALQLFDRNYGGGISERGVAESRPVNSSRSWEDKERLAPAESAKRVTHPLDQFHGQRSRYRDCSGRWPATGKNAVRSLTSSTKGLPLASTNPVIP